MPDAKHRNHSRLLSVSTDGKILVWREERDGRLVLAEGFAVVAQQVPRSSWLKKVACGEAAVGVTSLSFSHFDPRVFVVGVEGGYSLKCCTAAVTPALHRTGSSVPLRAPAELAFSPHGGPVYSVSCSPFHSYRRNTCSVYAGLRCDHSSSQLHRVKERCTSSTSRGARRSRLYP